MHSMRCKSCWQLTVTEFNKMMAFPYKESSHLGQGFTGPERFPIYVSCTIIVHVLLHDLSLVFSFCCCSFFVSLATVTHFCHLHLQSKQRMCWIWLSWPWPWPWPWLWWIKAEPSCVNKDKVYHFFAYKWINTPNSNSPMSKRQECHLRLV
jgi:hypothetical protein